MKKGIRYTVVCLVAILSVWVYSMRGNQKVMNEPPKVEQTDLPRLLDLGSKQCVPCKAMEPILEELRTEYRGKLQVDFIDIRQDEAAKEKYAVEMIPTQIFYDEKGKEQFRHVGFMSKDDIVKKWQELGVPLAASASRP